MAQYLKDTTMMQLLESRHNLVACEMEMQLENHIKNSTFTGISTPKNSLYQKGYTVSKKMGYHLLSVFLSGIALCMGTASASVLPRCGAVPAIKHADSESLDSVSYIEGSTVNYTCRKGFEPLGEGIYTCLNGMWRGSFRCTIKRCPPLVPPDHGKIIGDILEVGSVLKFECDLGYRLSGSDFSQCLLEASWSHKVPECQIVQCPSPPHIEHEYTVIENQNPTGKSNVYEYGTSLTVTCKDNLIRSGPARIYCDSTGLWTQAPVCVPSTCPSYPGLDVKCVLKTKVVDNGTLLFIYCTEHATFVHKDKGRSASCVNDDWDDLTMRCYCDCEVKADSDLVMLENVNANGLLRHGETLSWSCKDGTATFPAEPLTCNDGEIGYPKCVAPYFSPSTTGSAKKVNKAQRKGKDQEKGSGRTIAGIVGAIAVTALIVVLMVLFYIRKRRKARESGNKIETREHVAEHNREANRVNSAANEMEDAFIPSTVLPTEDNESGRLSSGSSLAPKYDSFQKSDQSVESDKTEQLGSEFEKMIDNMQENESVALPSSENEGKVEDQKALWLPKNTVDASEQTSNLDTTKERPLSEDTSSSTPLIDTGAEVQSLGIKDKYMCRKCGIRVNLSQEDFIGEEIYHRECSGLLLRSPRSKKPIMDN